MQTQFAEDLREALGAESAGKWLEFMDRIESSLPFLLGSAGRPTKEQIDSSVIGTAGFDSWTQMIEASPAYGGLGWSVDSWKAWKRAFAVVQDHAYLRDLGLSASEINTLAKQFKPFPQSKDEFESARAARKTDLEAKRGNSLASLKHQVTDLQGKLSTLEAKLTSVTADRDNYRDTFNRREADYRVMEEKLSEATQKASDWTSKAKERADTIKSQKEEITKLKRQLNSYQSMTWLDHLKALFGR